MDGKLFELCLWAFGQTLHEAVGDPWESTLLDVTLGRREPASVIAEADDVLRRCQALCYAGTHLITIGDLDAGRRHLRTTGRRSTSPTWCWRWWSAGTAICTRRPAAA